MLNIHDTAYNSFNFNYCIIVIYSTLPFTWETMIARVIFRPLSMYFDFYNAIQFIAEWTLLPRYQVLLIYYWDNTKSQYWVDIRKWHWGNTHFWKIRLILKIDIDPIITLPFTQYHLSIVSIDFILSCPLKEHRFNIQFLILRSQYWLDTQKYHWANIHFWKIRLVLEKYIDSIIVLSFSKLQIKRSCFSYIIFWRFWLQIQNQILSVRSSFYGIRLWSTHLSPVRKIMSRVRGVRVSKRNTIPTKRGLEGKVPLH